MQNTIPARKIIQDSEEINSFLYDVQNKLHVKGNSIFLQVLTIYCCSSLYFLKSPTGMLVFSLNTPGEIKTGKVILLPQIQTINSLYNKNLPLNISLADTQIILKEFH